MRFTVFTATYNRGYLLQQLYESLLRQTFRDFEWIIVDDGSTDNTETIVKKLQAQEHFFPIIYKKQQNGGKHRAWNQALKMAAGELFFGCDSDDYLTDDALEIADKMEKTIPYTEKRTFAGVCGLKAYKNSQIVGTTYINAEYVDFTYLERIQNKLTGDKAEVFYTSVWKQYNYYEFEGENFLTESTSLFRMAEDGLKIRFFNNILKIIEYLPGGVTATSRQKFINNPKGWGLSISQNIKYGLYRGKGKWDILTDYYNECKNRLSLKQMALNLRMNSIVLWTGVILTKIRYRLHL